MRHARRALIVAVLLVVVAGPAVLIAVRAEDGASSFAADEPVGRNELSAARVDIEVGDRTVPIVARNLAPGDVHRGSIEFANAGTVDLRYVVRGGVTSQGPSEDLARWLRWRAHWAAPGAECTHVTAAAIVVVDGADVAAGATLSSDGAATDRVLPPGGSDLLCLEVAFDLGAPNAVQATDFVQSFVAEAEQHVDTVGGDS